MAEEPKLHHYVPQFYLKNFADVNGGFWVWDKVSRKVYRTTTNRVAAQTNFYRVPEFIGSKDVDPLFLEKGLAKMEGEAAAIFRRWVSGLESLARSDKWEIAKDDRWAIAMFLSVQFLRTAEQRDILIAYAEQHGGYKSPISEEEKTNLHAYMLCRDDGLMQDLAARIFESIWVYARNDSSTPLWTSDNPVAIKTGDSRMWLKGPGILAEGSYVVFPLTPRLVLYCKEPNYWAKARKFDSTLSPVELTDEMVQHENAGQIFNATRHLISSSSDFAWADEFVETIGTDLYAPKDEAQRDG